MTKLKIGDVVEIPVHGGLAYAHYTHFNKQYGSLLRVFDAIYEIRPNDLTAIVNRQPAFSCFFPLDAAVKRKSVLNVGNIPVPHQAQIFPTFRTGVIDPSTGKVEMWWLWDGQREWPVGRLTNEQRKFPIRGVWNDTLLIQRIDSSWRPEIDPM
jgi:hypothetical protein